MAQVTIREVDPAWVEKARQEAVRLNVPVNQVLVEALRKGLRPDDETLKKSNLDRYAGDSDFGNEWDGFLDHDLKKIDPELWK